MNYSGGATCYLAANRTTSYSFKNWNTAQNGSGTSYNPGASYTTNAAVTLYAQWNSSTSTEAVTLPTSTREGFLFLGWARNKTAENAQYFSGDELTPSGNLTLYALWLDLSKPDGKLPSALKELEDEALAGCDFHFVRLPDGMTTLGNNVFEGCEKLLAVYVPAKVTHIAPHSFDGTPKNLIIIGQEGSDAATFATENGIRFEAVEIDSIP